jgi:lactosylceramide 4-alpha-galactosyltransferase
MDYISCRGINILPKSSFQPVYYGNMLEFFVHRLADNQTEKKPTWLTKNVVGIHTFNNLSFREPIFKNSSQYYTQIARDNCPFIFSMAPQIF